MLLYGFSLDGDNQNSCSNSQTFVNYCDSRRLTINEQFNITDRNSWNALNIFLQIAPSQM